MTINIKSLEKKREIFIENLRNGEYKSLTEIIVDNVGEFVQKITRNTRSVSYISGGLVIALIIILISLLGSLIVNEFRTYAKLDVIGMVVWSIFMGYLSLVGFYNVNRQFSKTVSETVLDSIQTVTDLESLQSWFISTSRIRRQLLFSFGFTVLMLTFFFTIIWTALGSQYPRFGLSIIATAVFFQVGLAVSYFIPLSNFVANLSTFKLKLYLSDPASSEVIEQLSHALNQTSLLGAGIIATLTFGFVFFEYVRQQTILGLILFSWAVFIIRFLSQQSSFTKIISQAKRTKLNNIQAQIEQLEKKQNLADKNAIETINRLMDYHDRVKNTPNSAINLRSGLSFLNSLLLPIIGFLLGNIETILKLLFK
jgi:hypothetical protein